MSKAFIAFIIAGNEALCVSSIKLTRNFEVFISFKFKTFSNGLNVIKLSKAFVKVYSIELKQQN